MLFIALGQNSQSITQSYQDMPSNEAKSSAGSVEAKWYLDIKLVIL